MMDKPHSAVDLITNSSTEIFIIKNATENIIKTLVGMACTFHNELDWFQKEAEFSTLDDGSVQIYSVINGPEWLEEYLQQFFKEVQRREY